ncbi:MAG: hypothetical protein DYG89_34470 [Caldilinea sp. CFX5]|nr:hypothetical protein [Caldilinea sp. CFX5]
MGFVTKWFRQFYTSLLVGALLGGLFTGVSPRLLAHATLLTNRQDEVSSVYEGSTMYFEANVGQTAASVKFLARGHGYHLFLTENEAILTLHKLGKPTQKHADKMDRDRQTVLHMRLLGAAPTTAMTGEKPLPAKVNYFLGNDPGRWRTNIPTFAQVQMTDVYPRIDLLYYGNQGELEYDFVAAPGADPKVIALEFVGADQVAVDPQGNLALTVAGELIYLRKPILYQEVNGFRQRVNGGYLLDELGHVRFQVGDYDPRRPLVIDPVLSYATYLGGSELDVGEGIAVDAAGSAYIIGQTNSLNFPTANAFQPTFNGGGRDVFIAKLSPDGANLLYATYLGGNGSDRGYGVTVDGAGNAYLIGETESVNFPTTSAFQSTLAGSCNAFITKVHPTGSTLLYSTYLGGNGCDFGAGIALDNGGNAYVTGSTTSTNFPVTPGAFDQGCGVDGVCSLSLGGSRINDAFVAALNSTGNALLYATYIGGSGEDASSGIALSPTGTALLVGYTTSTDFPTVNAIQPTFGGNGPHGGDAFVVGVNSTGSALTYATYLGGNSTDSGADIAVDSAGNAYVLGHTTSTNFPTVNGFRVAPYPNFNFDAFITKLNATGSTLLYSTYLGGSGDEFGMGIRVSSAGHVYVTGNTRSQDFPLASPLQSVIGGGTYGDAFVTQFDPTGAALVYSTYLGGNDTENIFGGHIGGGDIAVDSAGNAYVTGNTRSTNFPLVNAVQPLFGGIGGDTLFGADAFVVKIVNNQPPTVDAGGPYSVIEGGAIVLTASGNDPENGPLTFAWDLDNNGNFETPGQSATFSAAALNSPSSYTVVVRATDNSGSTAIDQATVTIIYNFSGFFQPVDNLPVLNAVNAGRAIPVKFSLAGDQGVNILAASYPVSQQVNCQTGAVEDDIEQTVTAGGSSLSYDAVTSQYVYTWKTENAWAGSCRQLIMRLNDGTDHLAHFKFK